MSRTTVTHLVVSVSAVSLAALVAACGAEAEQPDPITRANKVSEKALDYAGDPWEQRFLRIYWSDRAMSDVWQRHPELLQGTPVDGTLRARPGFRGNAFDAYRQDPATSARAEAGPDGLGQAGCSAAALSRVSPFSKSFPTILSIGTNLPNSAIRPDCSPDMCQVTSVPSTAGVSVNRTELRALNGLRKWSLIPISWGSDEVISIDPSPALRFPLQA